MTALSRLFALYGDSTAAEGGELLSNRQSPPLCSNSEALLLRNPPGMRVEQIAEVSVDSSSVKDEMEAASAGKKPFSRSVQLIQCECGSCMCRVMLLAPNKRESDGENRLNPVDLIPKVEIRDEEQEMMVRLL